MAEEEERRGGDKDKNWMQIRTYFGKKGMDIRVYTSIYEDGEDQLSNLIEDLKKEARAEEEKNEEMKRKLKRWINVMIF